MNYQCLLIDVISVPQLKINEVFLPIIYDSFSEINIPNFKF